MTIDNWTPTSEKLPEVEDYYEVKYTDGSVDEKPFRIRPRQNIKGFMTLDHVTHWRTIQNVVPEPPK